MAIGDNGEGGGDPGGEPGGSTINVGPGGSIQAAINAAQPGDTIVVAAGTYFEQLSVNGKNGLTIRAAQGATVVVEAPAAGLLVNGIGATAGESTRAVLAITNSTGVIIEDIAIDGNFETDGYNPGAGEEIAGVAIFNSSATLDNVDISDVGYPPAHPSFGIQAGVGLYIDGEDAAAGDNAAPSVSVENSTISGFMKTGVYVRGVNINFSNNVITGIGATAKIAQNGIQFANSAGTIAGNKIEGLGYDTTSPNSDGSYSSYIIAYEPTGALTIFGNQFVGTGLGAQGSGAGIDLSDTAGQTVTISANSFTGLDYGLYAYTYTGGSLGLDKAPVLSGNSFSDIRFENLHIAPEESYGAAFTTANPFNLTGSDGMDALAGSLAADTLNGAGGSDTLTGNGGNDGLNGGAGMDTAVYDGPASDYKIKATRDSNGNITSITVQDNNSGNGDEGTDTLTGVESLQFDGSQLNVAGPVQLYDQNDNLVGTFATIQAAEDAAQNDYTIRLAAGEYDEDVTIDVGVTILGAQAGMSATGRDPASAAGASNILGTVTVNSAQGVTIDGVRIVNDALGGFSLTFGAGSNASSVFTNSVIYSTVQDSANGRAIFIGPDNDGSILVSNSAISGAFAGQFGTASFDRGIWFDGGGRDLVVTNTLFENLRTAINLDMSGDTTATITSNVFRTVGSAVSVGVDTVGLAIADNDFQNVDTDFNFRNQTVGVTFDAGAAIDALTIAGNFNDVVKVLGGSGGDNFTGTEFADLLDGNFTSASATDADVLKGLAGNDQIFGKGGDDQITGGVGNDKLDGGANSDTAFFAGERSGYSVTRNIANGVETVTVTDIDVSNGDDGTDELVNFEFLNFGGQAFDAAQVETRSGSGNQTENGGSGSDIFFVGTGNDTVNGNGGDDDLYGESGNDALNGGEGNDELFGGSGTDTINGGEGNDDLDGGTGNDRMTGGGGSDDFIFQTGNGYDTITDFKVGSDQILIDGITIRSVTYKNVGGSATLDAIVTFGSGGGSVTLLDVGRLTTAQEGQLTAENGNPDGPSPIAPPPSSSASSASALQFSSMLPIDGFTI